MTSPALDALEPSDGVSMRETLRVFGRALRYVGPRRGRFAVKAVLTVLSLAPMAVLGFPVKIILDHVVLGIPIPELFASDWADTMLRPLEGLTRTEVLQWMIGIQVGLVLLVGMFGTEGSQRDRATAELSAGLDDATRTENEANRGHSWAGGLLGLIEFRFTMRLSQDLNHHYRSSLFSTIQRLPMTAFDDERIGDAVYRVMYDTPSITDLTYRLLITPVAGPLQIAITALLLLLVFPEHREIAVLAVLFLPLAFLASLPFTGAIRRAGLRSRAAGSMTTSTIEEGMSNIVAIQSLGAGERQTRRFGEDSARSFGRYRSYTVVIVGVIIAAVAAGTVLGTTAFIYVTNLVIAGQLSPGDFTLLLALFFGVLTVSGSVGRLWVEVQGAVPGLRRVFALMDMPMETDPYGARVLPRIERYVELDGVDFTYPDGTMALRGIDLRIPVGQVTALCGPAGAGKTTLAYMIPRFLQPTRGVVRADGSDVERVTRQSLREQVAFVFQENALFDATVAENLRMARADASAAELEEAARIAGAHDFIAALPQGYDTPLGRSGGKLSVGQKQRLSIARALLRDAPVLVLDEPTSALDPETELRLVQALRDASRSRAVVVIAHRLSTVRSADLIAFMEHGSIVERGSHAQLMALGGRYRRFVELQTRGAA
jgi:ABC-type multidrug transport system fused ATPase/permease subunit